MSKLIGFTAFAVVATAAVAIASLVLNIIILINTNTGVTNTNSIIQQVTTQPGFDNSLRTPCAGMGNVSSAPGWTSAANYLLSGIDESVDPCEDFYAFTCNKYLASVQLDPDNGVNRQGTYDQAQVIVNQAIVDALSGIKADDTTVSLTERITKQALDSCVYARKNNGGQDFTGPIIAEINSWFGGVPFLGGQLNKSIDLFGLAGLMEQTHALGTLMSSYSSVDYQQITRNALYVSQPSLDMPRDFFVLPQYIDKLTDEMNGILEIMQAYRNTTGSKTSDDALTLAAQDVVNFEVQMALASWPDDLMRNYKLQYNRYLLADLKTTYPNINFESYLDNLLSATQNATGVASDGIVLSQPSYFAWLNSVFQGKTVDPNTVANYMIVQLLMDDADYWGGAASRVARLKNHVPYGMRRGRGVRRIGRRDHRKFDQNAPEIGCVDEIMSYMPYGPGYVYVKAQEKDRARVVKDITHQTELVIKNFQEMVQTLGWMSDGTKDLARNKSNSLIRNYGWPDMFKDFKDTSTLDAYHVDYKGILDLKVSDFYEILKTLKTGMEVREFFRILTPDGNTAWGNNLRANFLSSPAEVNAWYQPERNSITFPYAIWNPPYYNVDYPQAYNYAGQGGTGGHELTHGFDDEGVQFDWDGSMTECSWNKCGWMDADSSSSFTDMAQCVVSQYSTQCCPVKSGNVHCANGATTQGENIADLGGQQAAYFAYQEYINEQGYEEPRLPGMSKYTPNQVFWMTYAYSWCMKQTDANLVNQLLTNPHAPGSCRTNQVMQDIPSFGKDFNCKQGQPMYPTSDQRCKVWVGY